MTKKQREAAAAYERLDAVARRTEAYFDRAAIEPIEYTGSTHALAVWFGLATPIHPCTGSDGEATRDRILASVYAFRAFGVSGRTVIIDGPKGRTLIERKMAKGCPVVVFTHNDRGTWKLSTFWMNASSVRDLGDLLRASPAKRIDFMTLYINDAA
jgi:hypothetical protein